MKKVFLSNIFFFILECILLFCFITVPPIEFGWAQETIWKIPGLNSGTRWEIPNLYTSSYIYPWNTNTSSTLGGTGQFIFPPSFFPIYPRLFPEFIFPEQFDIFPHLPIQFDPFPVFPKFPYLPILNPIDLIPSFPIAPITPTIDPIPITPKEEKCCGWSTKGSCFSDSDCIKDGCSGQVCRSVYEEGVGTTCEWRDCYGYCGYCRCVMGQCQWVNF